MCILHGCIHDIDFSLHTLRLVANLGNDDGDLSNDPSHKDKARNVHDDNPEELSCLSWLHLIATDDKDRVVNADSPDVIPVSIHLIVVVQLDFCLHFIYLVGRQA